VALHCGLREWRKLKEDIQYFRFDVDEAGEDRRVDVFCCEALKSKGIQTSRTHIQRLIKEKKIKVAGIFTRPCHRLKKGDRIEIEYTARPSIRLIPQDIPLNIIYEDDDIIIVNKPSGMTVHPAVGNYEGTLVNALLFRYGGNLSRINPSRPGIVHRLDKDTSGVMVVAKNDRSHLSLVRQFSAHTVRRKYVAVVEGSVEFDEGVIDLPIGRDAKDFKKMKAGFFDNTRPAKTHYRTLKRSSNYSVLEVSPQTGRTHQLRVHLAHLGHPVLGDKKYARQKLDLRLMLHAKSIGFIHPGTDKFVEFDSELPKEFRTF